MGIFDKAKEALTGDEPKDSDEATGQQQAEQVEGIAGTGDSGTPPEDQGPVAPEGMADPLTSGQSPADAVRSPLASEADQRG